MGVLRLLKRNDCNIDYRLIKYLMTENQFTIMEFVDGILTLDNVKSIDYELESNCFSITIKYVVNDEFFMLAVCIVDLNKEMNEMLENYIIPKF